MPLSPLLPSSFLKTLDAMGMRSELWLNFPLDNDSFHATPTKFTPFDDDNPIRLPGRGSPPTSPFLPSSIWPAFGHKNQKASPYATATTATTPLAATGYFTPATASKRPECSWPPSPIRTATILSSVAPGLHFTLNSEMQKHFLTTQLTARRICDPKDIMSEAFRMAASLMSVNTNERVTQAARRVVAAGCQRVEHARTVALFAGRVMGYHSGIIKDETRPLAERNIASKQLAIFARVLDDFIWKAFIDAWAVVHQDSPDLHTGLELHHEKWREHERTRCLSAAALVGDLFAVGALRPITMDRIVGWLVERMTTLEHCRGVHMLLTRLTMVGMRTLSEACLRKIREVLADQAKTEPLFASNSYAWLWLQEIDGVIDTVSSAGRFDLPYSALAAHTHDQSVKWEDIAKVLVFEQPREGLAFLSKRPKRAVAQD